MARCATIVFRNMHLDQIGRSSRERRQRVFFFDVRMKGVINHLAARMVYFLEKPDHVIGMI